MPAPSMVVRVAGNIEDLKKSLQDGERTIQQTTGKILQFRRETESAVPAGKQVAAAYREFDGVLQSLGINIGPYVKGLEDVTNLVTKGIPAMGALGVAAGAVAAALAGWKLGEHAGQMYGWTDAIARGWSVLKGYGDVAQEVAMAQADAIDLLGHAQEMWKRQAEQIENARQATQEHTEAAQREGMVTAGNAAHMMALANKLDAVRAKRKADAEAARLQAHEQFFFGEETQKATVAIVEQSKAIDDRIERLREEAAAFAEAQRTLSQKPATLNDRASESWFSDVKNLTQTELNRLRNKNPLLSGEQNLRAELARLEAMEGNYAPKSGKQFSQFQQDTYLLAQLRNYFDGRSYAGGGSNLPGGLALVGERGPELVNLPGGSDVIPNHRLGTTVNLSVVFPHANMLDRGSAEMTVTILMERIMERLNATGLLHPSAA